MLKTHNVTRRKDYFSKTKMISCISLEFQNFISCFKVGTGTGELYFYSNLELIEYLRENSYFPMNQQNQITFNANEVQYENIVDFVGHSEQITCVSVNKANDYILTGNFIFFLFLYLRSTLKLLFDLDQFTCTHDNIFPNTLT